MARAAYADLIEHTLSRFSTSLEDDLALLSRDELIVPGAESSLPPRMRLAVQFRVIQKRGLRAVLRQIAR